MAAIHPDVAGNEVSPLRADSKSISSDCAGRKMELSGGSMTSNGGSAYYSAAGSSMANEAAGPSHAPTLCLKRVVFCFQLRPQEGTDRHGNGCVAFFRLVAPRHLIGRRRGALLTRPKCCSSFDVIRPRPPAVSTTSARAKNEEAIVRLGPVPRRWSGDDG
jgi:hypothetical protein